MPIPTKEIVGAIERQCGLSLHLSGKESACDARDTGDTDSIPGSGRSPGGEYGNQF